MEHICFFNTAIAWGGGEKWHFEVSAHLHAKGHPLVVFAHKKSVLLQKLTQAKIPSEPVELSNLSFLNPFTYKRLKRQLGKYPIKTIVMNLSRDLKIAGPCAKAIGVKNIIYRRGSAIPIKNSLLNRFYFGKILTAVLANSEATKQTILKKNPNLFPEAKIEVIYNGVPLTEKTKSKSNRAQSHSDPFVILNLGRLEEQKNQHFLIPLAIALRKRGLHIEILIGGEGRLRPALEQSIAAAGLEEVVRLCGFIEDPIDFIQKADVFVLPSLWEGFGYVLAEAAFCQKPVVAFNVSSNPEVVVHKKTGFLVPPNDIEAFAKAVEELYHNPKKAKKMGESGLAHVKEHFDKEKQLLKIEAYLLHE